MKKIWIGTTWKMNKSFAEAKDYVHHFADNLDADDHQAIFLVLPFVYLTIAKEILGSSPILLGAQNMHWAESGEFTGEISPAMLSSIGVNLVEIGHSERRLYFNEDDVSINKKIQAALKHQLIPLLCVGENYDQRQRGEERDVITRQVGMALRDIDATEIDRVRIAYEPVWAIGKSGIPADPGTANEMQTFIHEILVDDFGREHASHVPILYGGSVDISNAVAFLEQPAIDGLFIGRAGLDPRGFQDIITTTKDVIAL